MRKPLIETFTCACARDAEVIAGLVNRAYRPAGGARGWTHEAELVSGNRVSAQQVRELIAHEGSSVFLGRIGAQIVACVHLQKDGEACHIGMLAVEPELQGAGTGKLMLAHAERYAIDTLGSLRFLMHVLSSRESLIAFYLRRGYRRTGIVVPYPSSANVGTPRVGALTVEVLEKTAYPLAVAAASMCPGSGAGC